MANIANEYLVKRGVNDTYATFASLFNGLRILSIEGFNAIGETVNVYTAQWVNSQDEDIAITTHVTSPQIADVVVRKNTDISITFIISDRYANAVINVGYIHDTFIEYMTSAPLFVKSKYVDKEVQCMCLSKYEPTDVKLKRPRGLNYIMGTLTLHKLATTTRST